jgi:uncharacterized protein (TIGR02147 family)
MTPSEPVNIFAFLDYRVYLDAYYQNRKGHDKKFSHRFIGKTAGFDPGLFSKIIQGKRDISAAMVFKLVALLKLNKKQTEYFQCLILYNQSTVHSERKHHFEKLMLMRGTDAKAVELHQYQFYSKWYYSALRELLDFHASDGGDYEKLARLLVPAIKPSEAKQGLELLEKLGFAVRDSSGRYRIKDALITTGYGNTGLSANNFVLESLDLAKGAIDRFPASVRNLSTVTFSIPKNRFAHYEEKIRGFRRELMQEIEREKGTDVVYQLNLQLFPLSLPRENGSHV